MNVDSGNSDTEKTLLGIKLLHLDNDIGDLDQELKGASAQDATYPLPSTNSPFLVEDERRKLETMRSSSAPPSLFFSTFDLFGNNNKLGEDDVSLETVYEGVQPDDPRLDPAYFEYYYTYKRNDPRFPKPLLSYTDFRIALERRGKNYSKEFLNDLKEASSKDNNNHHQEEEDMNGENSKMNNNGNTIKQPQPVIGRRVPVSGTGRPSTPGTIGDRVSSKLPSNIELSNLSTVSLSDTPLASPSSSSTTWPKSVMDRIQEDFPRTPSPALSNNALRKPSSPGNPIERVRSFGDIACSDALAPGSPSVPASEKTRQTERNSSFYDMDSLKVSSESNLKSVQGSAKEVISNGSGISRKTVPKDNIQNDYSAWQISSTGKDTIVNSTSKGVSWKMNPQGMEYTSAETAGVVYSGRQPKPAVDNNSQSYSRMDTFHQTGFSPFIGTPNNPFLNDASYTVPSSSYLVQPSQQLYAAQFAQFAAYNAAAAAAATVATQPGNPPAPSPGRNAFYASPPMTGLSFPGMTPMYPNSGVPSNVGPSRETWNNYAMNSGKFLSNSYQPPSVHQSMEREVDTKAYIATYNRVAADNNNNINNMTSSSFHTSPSRRGGKSRRGVKSKTEQEDLPKERAHSVETKRSPLLEEFRQTCLVGRPNSNAQSVSQLYPSAFNSSAPVRNWELADIRGHFAEFASDQHGSRFIQQKVEGCSLDEIRSLVAELGPDIDRLVIDVFGNYVVQKLLEYGDENIRQLLTKKLEGHMLSLSLHMYGCRVVQKALEVLKGKERTMLVQELNGHVLQCIRDQNGNHVIQKCIELVEPESILFIVESVKGQAVALAEHAYGCRVVQRVLEHCPMEHKAEILAEIMSSARDLIRDQYGNYVIQHIVEKGDEENKAVIMKVVMNEVVAFAQHKFASNVVERCLQYGSPIQRMDFIEVLVRGKDSNPEDCPLSTLVKDQFGNYVVQRILDVANEEQLKRVVYVLKEQIPYLKKYSYGKHIIAKLENLRS